MPAPLVSVVTATHNRPERLAALFAALRAQELPLEAFEVIVVDDASTDTTADVLEREVGRGSLSLRVMHSAHARGPATARNRGWRAASAPLIAFTDDDCEPTPGWLNALLGAAGDRQDAIIAGRTLPNPAESDALGPYAKTVRIEQPSPHFETCNVLYPRGLLEQVGGFDETFPSPAGEDSDLGCRAVNAGAESVFVPDALVYHAVFARDPIAALRDALLAADGVQAYKRNPDLRRHLPLGVFYGRSHVWLLQALVAMRLARHNPHAAVLVAPYLWNVARRCRTGGGGWGQAAFYPAFDAIQIAATVRGAVRNRTFMI